MRRLGDSFSKEEGALDNPEVADDSGVRGIDGQAGPTSTVVAGSTDDIWSDVAAPQSQGDQLSLNVVAAVRDIELPKPEDILPDLEPGNLPNISGNVTVIDGGVAKVADLNEIAATISGNNAVSKSDAQLVHDNTGDLLSKTLGIEEFTETPTKTNLSLVVKNINDKIAEKMASTNSLILSTVEDLVSYATKVKDIYGDQYTKSMLDSLGTIINVANINDSNILTSKNLIIPSDGDFFNIITSNVAAVPNILAKAQLGMVLTEEVRSELYVSAYAINNIIESNEYFKSVVYDPKANGVLIPEAVISIKSILQKISDGEYSAYIEMIYRELCCSADKLAEIKARIDAKELSATNWDKSSTLTSTIISINHAINIICRLPMFLLYVEKFVTSAILLA